MSMIPAHHFRAKSSGDGIIRDYVIEFLRLIEDDIAQSIENDRTNSKTEIATYFDVPGMVNSRAQRHIYYHILTALRKAKYIPTIEIKNVRSDKQIVFIHVTWLTKEDTDHENYMDRFINSHQFKKTSEEKQPISRRRRGKKTSVNN